MSVLDDAIREHLELRRRNGASEQEIAVKEAEALGPARRHPETGEADPVEEGPALEEQRPATEPAEAPLDAESEADLLAPDEESDADLALADERLDIDMPEAIEEESEVSAVPEAATAPADDPPPPAASERPLWRPLEHSQAERRDRGEQSAPAAPDEQAPPPDDVLEETPDFLQETPEHERLWFEQRPPRDFDFDD